MPLFPLYAPFLFISLLSDKETNQRKLKIFLSKKNLVKNNILITAHFK